MTQNDHLPLIVCLLLIACLLFSSCAQMRALSLRNEAEKLYKEGRTAEIIPMLEEALPDLKRDFGEDHDYVAECYNGLAMAYGWVENDFETSEDYFLKALDIRTRRFSAEDPRTLETRRYLGLLYQVTGNQSKAELQFREVLEILEKTLGPEHPDTAETMIMLGQLYYMSGDYATAERLLIQASKYEENTVSARYPSPADAISILGGLYMMLGDMDKAEQHTRQALDIRRKVLGKDHSMIALSYESLGHVAMARQDYQAALNHFTEAQRIKIKVFGEHHGFIGDSYMTFSLVHFNQGDLERAIASTDQAAKLYAEVLGKDNQRYLMALFAKGVYLVKNDDIASAKELFVTILSSEGVYGIREMEWGTSFMYSLCLAQQKQTEAAIFFAKQAVNIIQELRSKIQLMDSGIHKNYLPSRESAYRFLAGLLIESGRIPEAQQVLSMLKEEEYFDYIRRNLTRIDTSAIRSTYTLTEETWSKRYQDVHQDLVSLSKELADLRKRKGSGTLNEDELARLTQLRGDLKLAKTVYRQFLLALEQELSSLSRERVGEISSKNLDSLKAMQGVLREMNGEAVLIHYLMMDDLLYIILTTDQVQLVRKVNIGAAELNTKIARFRQLLESPANPIETEGQELYQILIAPIAEDLAQSGCRVLMVSMDGALRYLPVAALHSGRYYLVQRYGVVLFTEAAKAKILSRPNRNLQLAGLGLSREIQGFPPLPSVKEELDAIIRRVDDDDTGVLPGEIYLDEEFTPEMILDVLDRNFSVLHIASHFVFQPGTESSSYLLLGDGSRLSLATISEEDMDFNNVELLTLSACDTAVGGAGQDGSEIEGFGSLAQRQGAKTVIATLWPVADKSTSIFMVQFYTALQTDHSNKALALQKAQRRFIASNRYNHPFFWAPFIMMGNWL